MPSYSTFEPGDASTKLSRPAAPSLATHTHACTRAWRGFGRDTHGNVRGLDISPTPPGLSPGATRMTDEIPSRSPLLSSASAAAVTGVVSTACSVPDVPSIHVYLASMHARGAPFRTPPSQPRPPPGGAAGFVMPRGGASARRRGRACRRPCGPGAMRRTGRPRPGPLPRQTPGRR